MRAVMFCLLTIISCVSFAETDYTDQALALLNKTHGKFHDEFKKSIDQMKGPGSQSGAVITKSEFDLLQDYYNQMKNADFGDKPKSNGKRESSVSKSAGKSTGGKFTKEQIANFWEKLNSISSINKGKTDEEKAEICLKLLDYYKSLVVKTADYKMQVGRDFVDVTRAESMLDYPVKTIKEAETELGIMQKCVFPFNNINDSLVGDTFSNSLDEVAKLAYVKQKISDNLVFVQSYKVKLNPVRALPSQPLTMTTLSDESFLVKTNENMTSTGKHVFFSVFAGQKEVKLTNGFQKNVPYLIEVSPLAIDAFLFRLSAYEPMASKVGKIKVRCGFQYFGKPFHKLSPTCSPAQDYKRIEAPFPLYKHRKYGFYLYPFEDWN